MKERIITKNNTKDKTLLVVLGLVGITTISGIILSSPISLAEDASTTSSARAAVTVGSACSLTSSGNSHTATISPGNYQDNIGTTTITTICNDPGGYALYAIGYTGDSYDSEDHTKLIGEGVGQKITTGTSTSGSTSNWAMKLNKVTDSSIYGSSNLTITNSYDNYNEVPATYTKVASYSSTTDTTQGSKLTTTYAAYIAGNQAADTYTGKVKYTMVHPSDNTPNEPKTCASGKICYYPNAGNRVTDSMDDQSASSNAETTLWASNFKRSGYGFAGWSPDFKPNENSVIYGPNETITTPDLSNNGLSLYAVWVKSSGTIQGWNKCNTLDPAAYNTTSGNVEASLTSVTALTDLRDNNTYAVARLADNNCWMIENLRLNDSALLSSENTNNPVLPLTNDFANGTTSNHLSATSNDWCGEQVSSCIDQSIISTENTENSISNMTSAKQSVYSYGNYYNWYSATAGNGTYSKTSGKATGDICPFGWQLPTGGNSGNTYNINGNFAYLDAMMGGGQNDTVEASAKAQAGKWQEFPNNFVRASYKYSAGTTQRGISMRYWSSTAYNNKAARSFVFTYDAGTYKNILYPGTGSNEKTDGRAVRCLIIND